MVVYKDLARYWMGFVPVTALVGLGVVLGPTAEQLGQVGFETWWDLRWQVLVVLLLALAVLVAMTAACAQVLAAEPTDFNTLLGDRDWLSDAFSKYGVGRPYFLDSQEFLNANRDCRKRDDKGAFDPRAAAVSDATSGLSTLSANLNAKAKFKMFTWVFFVGAILMVGAALLVFGLSSGDLQVISAPTSVKMLVPVENLAIVTADSGCHDPADATVVAVKGTWTEPTLRLFGPGCTNAEWAPSSNQHILIVKD